jgi:glycine/D-amino acid oxidase-like deaminating enzyme
LNFFDSAGSILIRAHILVVFQNTNPLVSIPLHPTEHFYILSKSLDVDHMLPVIRDPDGSVYFREWGGGLCAGGFERHAKPCFHEKTPENFEFQLLPENWDQFGKLIT